MPPQKRASGAEIAPLADGAAEPEEHPEKRAEREVAEAEELLRQWEASRRGSFDGSFDLTVQPVIGGEGAAITLKSVWSGMSVSALHERVEKEMESKPTPDEQRLFILAGKQGPLRDETLPIGAYGVVAGVTVHLAMRDDLAAAASREARAKVRAAHTAAEAAQAEDRDVEAAEIPGVPSA